MEHTYELRWFFDTPLEVFDNWGSEEPTRTDWYAPLLTSSSSVKLRESRLESKFLYATRSVSIGGQSTVHLQQWAKYSHQLPAGVNQELLKLATQLWLPVHKRRCLRFYRLAKQQVVAADAGDAGSIQVEWTNVSFQNDQFWTFGLEGDTAIGRSAIVSLAEFLIGELPLPMSAFPPAQSYPHWIMEQTGRRASAL